MKLNCASRHASGTACADLVARLRGTACEHRVELYDSYGDGWNGNTLDVYVDGVLILSGITLESGAGPAVFTFLAGTGGEIHTVYNAIGGWSYEPYYMIYDGLGVLSFRTVASSCSRRA